jgi:nicotinate-nucleotide adenylyltransferase
LKKIGIYGGTFDPIHHGHLILAREAREKLGLSTVIFVLTAQSPHKTQNEIASATARWEMLMAAIEGEPGFIASALELQGCGPSYTIDTVEKLKAENPGAELFFLLGEDNLAGLPAWRRFEDLRRLVQFIVLDRSGTAPDSPYLTLRRRIDISATTIRNRVASHQSIRYLVPDAVREIIRREKLYEGNTRSNQKS